MAENLLGPRRESSILSRAGGLITSAFSRLGSATGFKKQQTPALIGDGDDALRRIGNVTPSLAAILRPQAAYRWLLPYLASITPTYVESILRGALAGNHVQSWELFDLMMDTSPELASCVQEYIEGVLSHKIIFEPHHEEEEEPSELAEEKCKVVAAALRSMRPDPASDENALRDTLRDLLFARFHGQSVCEVDWLDTFGTGERYIKKVQDLGAVQCVRSTFWVHPVCYAWGVDGRLGLRGELTADRGSQYGPGRELAMRPGTDRLGMSMVQPPAWNWISSQPRPSNLSTFPRNKFLISVFKSKAGTALGGSCLRPLAALWVFGNFCQDYLMNTAQLFQVPFRKATYAPNTPPAVQEEIRHMLQSMGSAGWGLFPQGVTVDFESASTNSGSSPAAYIIHYADAAIRKVVLHQTMTGGSHDSMGKGGGKAFGEVESDTKDQCIEAGAEFAAEQVNSQLIPMVLELNYGKDGDQEAPVCKLVDSEVGGLADAQRDQVLSQIVDIPSSYVRRKYGIPKAGPDDEIAGVEQGIAGATAKQAQQNVEADRDQKAKAAKQQADALAKQPKAAPGANGNGQPNGAPKPGAAPAPGGQKQPGQQEKQPGADDNEGMDGRAAGNGHRFDLDALEALEALEASSEEGHPFYGNQYTDARASAFAETKNARKEKTAEAHDKAATAHENAMALTQNKDSQDFHRQMAESHRRSADDKRKFDTAMEEHRKTNEELDRRLEHVNEQRKALAEGKVVDPEVDKLKQRVEETQKKIRDTKAQTRALMREMHREESRNSEIITGEIRARHTAVKFDTEGKDTALALHETAKPLLDRIDAIAKVPDTKTRTAMMRKLLKDMPHIAAAMVHDDAPARAIAPAVVKRFVQKLAKESKKGSAKT